MVGEKRWPDGRDWQWTPRAGDSQVGERPEEGNAKGVSRQHVKQGMRQQETGREHHGSHGRESTRPGKETHEQPDHSGYDERVGGSPVP